MYWATQTQKRWNGYATPMRHKFSSIETWTRGKADNPARNEDRLHASETVLVLADGATDKTGVKYPSGKTGGRELAEIATRVAANSLNIGYELADEVTDAVREFYAANNPDALSDASKQAATTLAVARIFDDTLTVTQLGDTNIRITHTDGSSEVLTNDKLVDTENAITRAEYIRAHLSGLGHEPTAAELEEIIAGGRAAILDRLSSQYLLQNNNADKEYGYCFVDGKDIHRTFTDGAPTHFVKVFAYPVKQLVRVELVSDGFYGEFPQGASVEEYQALYEHLHQEDPHKYLKYLSTKPIDDATVVTAELN